MNVGIKFTFIVPNYNKGCYINECLTSIYNQTYKNFEVIVIDDGSTDNSIEEIKKFTVDRLLITDRRQAGGARNAGLKHATGDYIVFLDSDDYLTNELVLEKLVKLIVNEDIVFLNFTKNKFGEIEEIVDSVDDIEIKIAETMFLGCPTKCFKRSLIEGISFSEGKRYEDIVFTLEAMCKASSYTYFVDSFFVYRRVKDSNSTSPIMADTILDIMEELMKIYRLCIKYPKYKGALMKRIKADRLSLRLEVLDKLIETGENTYRDYF